MRSFDTIIVGAGIMGCTLFHELTTVAGAGVCLVESDRLAAKTTGQSPGYIGLYHSDPWSLKCAEYGIKYYRRWAEFGVSMQTLPLSLRAGNACSEYQALRIDSTQMCEAMIASALDNGGRYYSGLGLSNYQHSSDGTFCVTTSKGLLYTKRLILALGAGLHRSSLFNCTDRSVEKAFQYNLYHHISLEKAIIDKSDGIYGLPTLNGKLAVGFLNRDKVVLTERDRSIDGHLSNTIHAYACKHLAQLTMAVFDRAIAFDSFSPNEHGFIEPSKGSANIWIASGLSANGITQTPWLVTQFINSLA